MANHTRAEAAYATKTDTYFAGVRRDFLELLPRTTKTSVLEIGCGFGETGQAALVDGYCGRYCGVELFPDAAERARKYLTEVVAGDVEKIELPWTEASFDALLMSEVLEHLVDPWSVVERVVRLLRPGGLVVASSPNVAQFTLIRNLILGRFELTDSGLMDRTHLRWFTPTSYREMFEKAGVQIQSMSPMAPPGRYGRLFNIATVNRFSYLTMRQIRIIGYVR